MTFFEAIEALRAGGCVRRSGWSDGIYLSLNGRTIEIHKFERSCGGREVLEWTAYTSEIFAEDWQNTWAQP